MTERKPPGMGFESWVDKQIREAAERGAFDNLPGTGEPIRDLDTPYDEVWVRRLLQEEGATPEDVLPLPLRLRLEVERLPETVRTLRSEQAVRDAAEELNERITAWRRAPLDGGPPVHVKRVDVDAVVEQWAADRTASSSRPGPAEAGTAAPAPAPGPAERRRWWHRRGRPSK